MKRQKKKKSYEIYIRSRRLQTDKHFEGEKRKVDYYHPDIFKNACDEVTQTCIRCGCSPKTIGEGIHFQCSIFVKCDDCFKLEPHGYGTNMDWLFINSDVKQKTGKTIPMDLETRFRKDLEDDEDTLH
jgi:hypothetical protein